MSALTYLHTDAGFGRIKEPIFVIEQKEDGQKTVSGPAGEPQRRLT